MKKIAIISSHPIQYNAPLFAMLSKEENIDLRVFYTWGEDALNAKYDPDFQKTIKWDIPLLEGYNYQFLENTSKEAGSHHFSGIVNPTLTQEIESWGADIVWVWGWSFNSHLKALRYFKRKKELWFRGDSTLIDEPQGLTIKKILRRIFLRWIYSHVDKAFYVGTHNKEYYIRHGLKESQLVYAPHAIDNKRFEDIDGELNEKALLWRRSLGIQDDQKVLLFAGKFEPKKNPKFIISEIEKLADIRQFKVILVGNGPLEAELKSIANDRCIFLPFQNQKIMPLVYRMGDIFILPSTGPGETWGLAINEALASGIPVIASSKCGGAINLINKGSGVIIDIFKSNILDKAIKQILSEHFKHDFKKSREELLLIHSYKAIVNAVISQI